MGAVFPNIDRVIRREINKVGFEYEDAESIIEILVLPIDRDHFPELVEIREKLAKSKGSQYGSQKLICSFKTVTKVPNKLNHFKQFTFITQYANLELARI